MLALNPVRSISWNFPINYFEHFFSGARVDLDKVKRRICVNLPFFHIAGIMSIMHSMGSTLVLPSPHFSGEHTLQTIVKEKCDVIYGTPNSKRCFKVQSPNHVLIRKNVFSVYVDLVAKQKKMSLDLPKIVFSVVGGAICTPKLVKDVKKYLNIHDFRSSYGMTETCASGFQSMSGEDEHTVLNYVGHVSENIEVKVVDNEGKVVPFGTPGELCIRGYCTMLGYWEDEAKTKEAMGADGW